jgi:hypothetical protein
MEWFGAPWNGTFCAAQPPVPPPVGLPCQRCGEHIDQSDQGVIVPFLGAAPSAWSETPYHLHCFLDNLGIKHD